LADEQIRGTLHEIAGKEGITVTPKGMKAILHLSSGDMRKCLNILQSTSMSLASSPETCGKQEMNPDDGHSLVNVQVDEAHVYQCTGNPSPGHIHGILEVLLNSTFQHAFDYLQRVQTEHGWALLDILKEIQRFVTYLDDLSDESVRFVLSKLAQIEYDLAKECMEELQMAAFVATFQLVRC